jgi:hypothetical protein
MLHPDARISATTKVQIQSHPGERWTASCCALNKRDGRSLTLVAPPSRTRLAGWTGLTLLQIKRKALVPNEKKLSAEGRRRAVVF